VFVLKRTQVTHVYGIVDASDCGVVLPLLVGGAMANGRGTLGNEDILTTIPMSTLEARFSSLD